MIDKIWRYVRENYHSSKFNLSDTLDWSSYYEEFIDLLNKDGDEYTLAKQDIENYINVYQNHESELEHSFKTGKTTKNIDGEDYTLEEFVLKMMIENIDVKRFEDQDVDMQSAIREYLVDNDIWKDVKFLGVIYDLNSSYNRKLLHTMINKLYNYSIQTETDDEDNIMYFRTADKEVDYSYREFLNEVKKFLKFSSDYERAVFDIVSGVQKVDYSIVEKEQNTIHELISNKDAKGLKAFNFKYFQIWFE